MLFKQLQGMASEQSRTFLAFTVVEERKPQPSQWRSPKCNLWIISGINYLPITGKSKSILANQVASPPQRSYTPRSNKSQNEVFSSNEKGILGKWIEHFKDTQSLTHCRAHTRCIRGRKHHHCNRVSPSCRNNED